MVSTRCFVVIVIVLYEIGCIVWKRVDHTAAQGVFTGFQISKTLGAHGRFFLVTGLLAVFRIKISFGIDAGHVIHGGGYGCLDASIQRSGVECHTAPAADADDADTSGINLIAKGEKVYGSHKVFRVDVRGGHIADIATALAGEGGVESECQKAAFRHCLRIETGALLFDCPEGAADCNGRELAFGILRNVQIGGQGDAITIYKRYLAVVDLFTFREGLIPCLRKNQFFLFDHC